MLVCASFDAHCTRDRGCSAHPVFPAPSVFEGDVFSITSGASRRENANVCQVPVIATSEATKQSILCAARWIASRACHRARIRATRWLCAEHDRQLGGESPLSSLMVAKD